MNIDRFVTVVNLVQGDIKAIALPRLLAQSVDAVLQNVNGSNEANQRAAKAKLDELISALERSMTRLMSPGETESLADISVQGVPATTLLGLGLAREVEVLLESHALNSVELVDGLRRLQKLVSDLAESVDLAVSATSRLGQHAEGLEPGESSVGMTMPRAVVKTLQDLDGEIRFFQNLMTNLSECVSGSAGENVVLTLRSSNPGFDVKSPLEVTALFASIVTALKGLFDSLKAYRDWRNATPAIVPVRVADQVEAETNEIVAGEMAKIKAEIVQRIVVTDGHRKQEVETHVAFAVEGMAYRIERDFRFDARTSLPSDATDSQRELATSITAIASLSFSPMQGVKLIGPGPAAGDNEADTRTSQPVRASKKTRPKRES